jgi:dTDP-glucose 4,6-dehydratase
LHEGKIGEVYNIGARQEKPNLEIAHLILGALKNSKSVLEHVKDRPGHDRRYAIDPSKVESELHWKPEISFYEGLRQTIDWYKSNPLWVEHVRSGQYLSYYSRMYQDRDRTLSEL